jgi:hypothetical protein
MTWRLSITLGALLVALALFARLGLSTAQSDEGEKVRNKDGKESDSAFAVVELFTSEGCSSCPPADALLRELVQETSKDGRRVFCLGFHVDYWNRLGWTDPYSSAKFSQRQQAYARAMKADRVYTPQMIVNGSEEFVGSDRKLARASIDAALKRTPPSAVKLQQEKSSGANSLALTYVVAKPARGAVLQVAVVESNLRSEVKRGENGGRTLRHDNVVRAFQTLRVDEAPEGRVELKLPADLVRKNATAIAYIQEGDTRAIVGATALTLAPAGDESH